MKRNLKINLICIGIILFFGIPFVWKLIDIMRFDGLFNYFNIFKNTFSVLNFVEVLVFYPGVFLGTIALECYCSFSNILITDDILLCAKTLTGRHGDYIFIVGGTLLFYGLSLILIFTILFRKVFIFMLHERKLK